MRKFWAAKSSSAHSDAKAIRVKFQRTPYQASFLGYAFDPHFRYNVSLAMDQSPWNQEEATGRAALLDAYVSSWHIPLSTTTSHSNGLVQIAPESVQLRRPNFWSTDRTESRP